MISKNIRTKGVLLNDGRKLDITEEQYAGLKLQLEDSKFSDPLVIKDADTGDIIFDGKVGAIKEFIHKKAKVNSGDVFICEFGNRHPLSQVGECDCKIEFDCMSFQFQDRLKEMGFNFDYPRFITDEMRIVYKKKYL